MAAACIDTAVRNAVAAGCDINYLALLDNFCWCSSTDPFRLGQLKRAAKACYDYSIAFGTPFISGKDSMFNDFKGFDKNGKPVLISIPPTLLISSIGVINDVIKTVSLDIKFPGDLVYLLGETFEELGGSEYFAMHKYIGNIVPKVVVEKNKKLYLAFYRAVQKDLIASAISVGRGGLGIALSKTAIAGMLGIDVSLKNLSGNVSRNDYALFSESQGRIVVTINPKNKSRFENLMKGNAIKLVGKVSKNRKIVIKGLKENVIVNTTVEDALQSYRKTFRDY
jgi:phosphoribosylformylglycinamidine synthase